MPDAADEPATKQANAQVPPELGNRVVSRYSCSLYALTTDVLVRSSLQLLFSPDQSMCIIQAQVDQVFKAQETNQFGSDRFVLLFMPGKYTL